MSVILIEVFAGEFKSENGEETVVEAMMAVETSGQIQSGGTQAREVGDDLLALLP